MSIHLVTGATGFVGGALVMELLSRTSDEIVVVVRGAGDVDAAARYQRALGDAIRAYQLDELLIDEARRRCRVVAGDVTAPGLGVGHAIGRVDQVWHAAASLRYEDRYRVEIQNTNVEGTLHVLELAMRSRATHFNYVSTAYVAGTRTGVIREELGGARETRANNEYERSKSYAEALVSAASGELCVRLLRPSVVIGHSRTRAAISFSGFYGALRQFAQFGGLLERMQPGLVGKPLRLAASADVTINLIPVDRVAAMLVGLAERGAPDGAYHLTNPRPPTVGAAVQRIFAELGFAPPIFTGEDRTDFSYLERKLDQRLAFYRSYMGTDKQFDRARVDAVLGAGAGAEPALDDAAITAYVQWYLTVWRAERAHLPVAR